MYHARQTMLNVEETDRLSFLPDLFGNDFLAGRCRSMRSLRNTSPITAEVSGISSVFRRAAAT